MRVRNVFCCPASPGCIGAMLDLATAPKDAPKSYIRPRGESKEEKAARKQTAKADKQARRVEKKSTKEFFAVEKQAQLKAQLGRERGGMGLKTL